MEAFTEPLYRTLKALAMQRDPNLQLPAFEGTPHNALHDAVHQARCAIVMRRAIFT